ALTRSATFQSRAYGVGWEGWGGGGAGTAGSAAAHWGVRWGARGNGMTAVSERRRAARSGQFDVVAELRAGRCQAGRRTRFGWGAWGGACIARAGGSGWAAGRASRPPTRLDVDQVHTRPW